MKTIRCALSFFHGWKKRAKDLPILLSILFLLINLTSRTQVVLQFPNGGGNGVLVSGTAGTVGAIYEWPNVGTEGGITIKARIEILSITGGATLTTIDGNSTAADWEPQVAGPTTTNGNSWGMKFQIRFYNVANGASYILSSLRAQGIDIDGGGSGSPLREYNTFQTPDSYTLENPTELTSSSNSDGTKFTSSASSFNGISIAQTQYIASCDYVNVSSINIVCGVTAVGGTVTATNRLHSFNFQNIVVFTAPVVELPIELVSFNAKLESGSKVKIEWKTFTELNNDYFTIERRDKFVDYCNLGIINGAGSSESVNEYAFIDNDPPFNEIIYYRLVQTDYDGKMFVSDPISVDNRLVKKDIVMRTDIMGQEVNEMYRGVVLVIYADGTFTRIVQ